MHMSQRFLLLIVLLTATTCVRGQSRMPARDNMVTTFDSLRNRPDRQSAPMYQAAKADRFMPRFSENRCYGRDIGGYLEGHPWFRLDVPLRTWLISPRDRPSTDWIFYLFFCCLLYIGLMRLAFPRYMGDLFLVFRNVVHRQKQLRDQVAQYALPSLMLNLFFCISGGIFLFFLWRPELRSLNWSPHLSILLLILLLIAIGLGKFLLLQLAGWLAGRQKEASAYAFIVFMVNKVGGILLLPVSLMLAYRDDADRSIWVGMAWFLVAALFLTRLVRAYDFANKELKINILHFVFMVFSFEVLPLMLIGKALGDLFL